MYAQLFLGLNMIILGFCHLFNVKFFIRKDIETFVDKDKIKAYQRWGSVPYFLIGVIILIMREVERQEIFQTPVYVGIYILLALIPISIRLFINKKFAGSYWPV